MVRQRRLQHADPSSPAMAMPEPPAQPATTTTTTTPCHSSPSQWIVYALASGACAALNGVFAKLTTTELTASLSRSVARILSLSHHETAVQVIIRGGFFALNLTFNGVMWTLFTKALAKGSSTTQVSVINTSTNFLLTALLGLLVFSEALPPLWWAGASLLVVGSVVVGRNDEAAGGGGGGGRETASQGGGTRADGETTPLVGDGCAE
ncbi:uncharacterized protein UV8b_00894 [Ustilaginoidea virens]|uniref:EamA domain-containing protein n=2 Tax=Ustilaginoidea virens TaxID=1159556 RepID=A0A8E5MDV1_USTVR|nr:uncharacterized protein UV8b_00894 [Ustilaginoidea virens]QUC16653.1 hypothetical protein UV8b_00894 [Ustilaginoidea virens]